MRYISKSFKNVFIKNSKKILSQPLDVTLVFILLFIPYAFIIDDASNIFSGIIYILSLPDGLLVDYMYRGGPGAALLNAASVGIFGWAILRFSLKKSNVKTGGIHIAAIWIFPAFALFGKNILNSIPIILGCLLYCYYKKEPFAKYVAVSIFATSLAPVATHMFFIYDGISLFLSLLLSAISGILIGFFIIPLALQTAKSHEGFHLYNVGFAAGILAMFLAILMRNFGFYVYTVSYWHYGSNNKMLFFSLFISFSILLIGFFKNNGKISLKECYLDSKTMGDKLTANEPLTYINMGLAGIFTTIFAYTLGELNGPNVGGVLTIIGFAAVGKNIFNMWPVMIGCILAAILFGWSIDSGILAIAIYSTTLAPLASKFGPIIGIISGILHISMAMVIVDIHGGLNLYNNGAAGGFVAIILLAVMRTFKKEI